MSTWKNWLASILDKADDQLDSLKNAIKTKLNLFDPLEVLVYNRYATNSAIHIFGRVLENKEIAESKAEDSAWQNLVNSYKRMNSDEVRDAVLQFDFQGKTYEARSDKEGYFQFEIPIAEPIPAAETILNIEVRLHSAPVPHEQNVVGKGKIFRPSADAKIAIVSDVDDTILATGATSLTSMLKSTFLQNAHTRRTFSGVSPLYQSLQRGATGTAFQPIFYVSSSPWNLYDLLTDFLDINQIPEGVLLLRDYGVDESKLGAGTHGDHKYNGIKKLLESYPELQFVLIGDSGQMDAQIYREVARDFPNRIAAIYIRDAQVAEKEAWMREQLAEAEKSGIKILWSVNSADFARDAFAKGLIDQAGLDAVLAANAS